MKKLKHGVTPGPYIESVLLDRSRILDPMHYAFQLPAICDFTKLDLHPQVTFFVGENGSGKSTLLEAIAVANGLNAEGGSRNVAFSTRTSHSKLHQALGDATMHSFPMRGFFKPKACSTLPPKLKNWISNQRTLVNS